MRQRLDLDALLRKYETNYSPRAPPTQPLLSPRSQAAPRFKLKTESSAYHENDLRVINVPQVGRDKVASVSFQMSKSECQALLLGVQEELAAQERSISQFIDRTLDQLLQSFAREHEELRREVTALLEQSLEQAKRTVLEMVQGYRRQSPREYATVGKHVTAINEEVSALLGGLGSSGFKRTIAEVVTRDFGEMIRKVRQEVVQANTAFRQGLPNIQLDRSRVARIQESLAHLYSWREAGMKVSDERDREDFLKSSRRSSKRKIFQTRGNKLAMTQREGSDHSAPKHMRRTFFNFEA